MSASDRHGWGPGELWVEDEETGLSERIGDVPPEATRRIKLRAAEDAVTSLNDRAGRLLRDAKLDEAGRRLRLVAEKVDRVARKK